MIEARKAFAYITQDDSLLVFRHTDFPEAGIQVPAGTVEPGETPEAAVMREAHEETGLTGLTGLELVSFLGYRRRDMTDVGVQAVHHRYFYHLRCPGPTPATWRHAETHPHGAADTTPIRFDFYWAALPDGVPDLIAGHGELLGELLRAMGLGG